MTDKRRLLDAFESAMHERATARDLVEIVIGTGWQPRPEPHPDSEHLEGVLANGARVPIEIRRAAVGRLL